VCLLYCENKHQNFVPKVCIKVCMVSCPKWGRLILTRWRGSRKTSTDGCLKSILSKSRNLLMEEWDHVRTINNYSLDLLISNKNVVIGKVNRRIHELTRTYLTSPLRQWHNFGRLTLLTAPFLQMNGGLLNFRKNMRPEDWCQRNIIM
jgi:hypothetical protein